MKVACVLLSTTNCVVRGEGIAPAMVCTKSVTID